MKYAVRCVAILGFLVAAAYLTFVDANEEEEIQVHSTGPFQMEIKEAEEDLPQDNMRQQLPHCGPNTKTPTITRRPLVLVSTLDGKMLAVDAEKGTALWSLFEGESNTMLSSTLPGMGIFPQIIPSLDGNLYKYDGNKVEPLPVSAENLLSSTFKYTPDMVMSGGKEATTYGVIPGSGKVHYKCGMRGCTPTGELGVVDDMLIVERLTQTVRAVDPRTGTERWNFSVGQHDVRLLDRDSMPGCQGGTSKITKKTPVLSDLNLRMLVSRGLLQAFSNDDEELLWERQLSAPIVHVWRLEENMLLPVDIFDIRDETVTSMLYVGEHQKQLYIQHTGRGLQQLNEKEPEKTRTEYTEGALTAEVKFPKIDWKPYQFTSHSRTPLVYPSPRDKSKVLQIEDKRDKKNTAVGRYDTSQYPYDQGNDDWDVKNDSLKGDCSVGIDDADSYSMDEELTLSLQLLSFWWKEILMMVVTLAVFLNLITQPVLQRIRRNRLKERFKQVVLVFIRPFLSDRQGVLMIEDAPPSPPPTPALQEVEVSPIKDRHPSDSALAAAAGGDCSPSPYVSRFLTDFEPISSLGRGGFGVVFHAKNNLDDRGYAVKRIQLPSKEEARVKVMREVKTLAKLEHKYIVRYFSAWVELPPPGWIQQHDPEWMNLSESQIDATVDSSSQVSSHVPQRPTLLPLTSTCDTATSFPHANSFSLIPDESKKEESDDSGGVVFLNEEDDESTPRDGAKDYCAVNIESTSPTCDDDSSSSSDEDTEDDKSNRAMKKRKGRSWTVVHRQKELDSSSSGGPLISYQMGAGDAYKNSVFDTSESSGLGGTIDTSQSFIVFDNTKPQQAGHLEKYKKKKEKEHSRVASPTGPVPRMYLYIQMELCERESLADWLWAHPKDRNHKQLLSMFQQILEAVEYVHCEGLIHRDLKPSNILFGQEHTVKVGDFGLVTAMSSEDGEIMTPLGEPPAEGQRMHTDQVGTRIYMSPELEAGKAYNYKVDIFSLGLMFYELLVPFSTQMERVTALTDVRKRRFPEWFKNKYPNEYELLLLMLSPNPDERPTTIGVRALPPMKELQEASTLTMPQSMHYHLQQRQRNNTISSQSSSGS